DGEPGDKEEEEGFGTWRGWPHRWSLRPRHEVVHSGPHRSAGEGVTLFGRSRRSRRQSRDMIRGRGWRSHSHDGIDLARSRRLQAQSVSEFTSSAGKSGHGVTQSHRSRKHGFGGSGAALGGRSHSRHDRASLWGMPYLEDDPPEVGAQIGGYWGSGGFFRPRGSGE
ncbi:unnamed protein product, partial [Discosporangium mesarthrocarpum]